jgi:pimeloyl-ACP methyl ester carboxylesterase
MMTTCWLGNKFIDRILQNRLKLPEDEQRVWKKYIKHVSDQPECSETGFYKIFDWPLQPARSIEMIMQDIKPSIAVDFLYGDNDWMRPAGAHRLAQEFKNIRVHEVENAGHQMLFDNPRRVS